MNDRRRRVARTEDQAVLEVLCEEGDALDRERHTIVYFYRRPGDQRDPERALNPMAQRLAAAGWQVADFRADGLVMESHRPADPDSVDQMAAFMGALAEEFGVDFDGWECAVTRDQE